MHGRCAISDFLHRQARQKPPKALQTGASIMPWPKESDLFVTPLWFLRDKSAKPALFPAATFQITAIRPVPETDFA